MVVIVMVLVPMMQAPYVRESSISGNNAAIILIILSNGDYCGDIGAARTARLSN